MVKTATERLTMAWCAKRGFTRRPGEVVEYRRAYVNGWLAVVFFKRIKPLVRCSGGAWGDVKGSFSIEDPTPERFELAGRSIGLEIGKPSYQ